MIKNRINDNFDLQEYLKRWEYLMPDYNPEYIPKEEREKQKRYCKNDNLEI